MPDPNRRRMLLLVLPLLQLLQMGAPVAAGAVSGAPAAAGAVSGAPVAAGAVSGAPAAAGAVSGAPVAAGAVSGAPVAAGAVSGTPAAAGAVSDAPAAAGAVSGAPAAAGAVSGAPAAAGAVSGAPAAAGAVSDAPAATDEEDFNIARRDERLFLANYATSTELRVSFSTTTVPFTCFSLLSNTACMGRSARFKRLRHQKSKLQDTESKSVISEIDSSMNAKADTSDTLTSHKPESGPSPSVEVEETGDDNGRKFFTVWNVAYSTSTMTTTYTDTRVTAQISAMCIPSGYPLPPLCG